MVRVTFENYERTCERKTPPNRCQSSGLRGHLVTDPFSGVNALKEERLRWLLEDHATLFPYDVTKARQCSVELKEYGKSLAVQLDLQKLFAGYRSLLEEADLVFLDVSESNESLSFQALHWEAISVAYPAERPHFPALAVRRIIGTSRESVALATTTTQPAPASISTIPVTGTTQQERLGAEPANWKQTTDNALSAPPAAVSNMTNPGHVAESTSNRPPPAKFPVSSRPLNVLMVVSRPKRKSDIDPLLASSALANVSERFRECRNDFEQGSEAHRKKDPRCAPFVNFADINFEVVRPGSWAAFKNCLSERKRQWEESGGSGPWFDIVHFDVHGAIWKDEAHLLFLDSTGHRTLWKSATKVRRRLRDHGVFFAIFNSCESAKVSASPLSNLASVVVNGGVQAAVAMPFKFTSSAARIFCTALYCRLCLVPGPPDLMAALIAGRWALQEDNIRQGRFGIDVALPDWVVPVIYMNRSSARDFLPWRQMSGQLYKTLSDMELYMVTEAVLPFTKAMVKQAQHAPLYGREYDILELEWLLLDDPDANTVLLTGLPGVGKSRLVKFLTSWWKQSHLVEDALYLSCKDYLPSELVNKVRQYGETRAASSRGEDGVEHSSRRPYRSRHLLVLDHLDIGDDHSSEDVARSFSTEQQEELQLFLDELSSFNAYVVLVNRSAGSWLVSASKRRSFHLDGLSSYHSGRLAVDYLKSIGLDNVLTEGHSGTWLDYLTCRLQYNPLAITTYLDGLKVSLQDPVNSRVKPSDFIRLYFNSLWQAASDAFFDQDPRHGLSEAVRECSNSITSMLNSMQNMEILVAGAIFSVPFGIFDPEWLIFALRPPMPTSSAAGVPESTWPSTTSEALETAKKAWIRSGWIEEVYITLPDDSSKQYLRGHPLFVNSLRRLFNRQGDEVFRLAYEASWQTFADFHYSKALQLMPSKELREDEMVLIQMETAAGIPWRLNIHTALTKSQLVTIQAEAANYLQSFAVLVKNKRLWQAAIILRLLWIAAERSATPALSISHLKPACTMFFEAVEAGFSNQSHSQKEKRLLSSYVEPLYVELARFQMEKSPRLAANYTRDALAHIMRYRDKASYWTADVKESIAHLLLLRACALYQAGRNSKQAAATCDMAFKFLRSLVGEDASMTAADEGTADRTQKAPSAGSPKLLFIAVVAAQLAVRVYRSSGQQELMELAQKEVNRWAVQLTAQLQPHWSGSGLKPLEPEFLP